MKRTLILLSLMLVVSLGCAARSNQALEFAETTYDFGTISEKSDPVVHEFEFVNTSDEPVAVLSASASCGCTRPEYDPKPVGPGKKSKIKVTFLPEGQSGDITRVVQVRYRGAKASSSKRITLKLKGAVVPQK